jgi:phospholipase C
VRRKDLETIRPLLRGAARSRLFLSRRRALQGLGAVLGASAAGCGGDDANAGDGTGSSESGSTGADPDSSGGPTSLDTSGADTTGVSDSVDSSSSAESSSSGDEESSTGETPVDCEDDGGLTPEELLAEIDTIVVVCMENRSFDHYFGSAAFLEGWQIEGLTGDETNDDLDGNPVQVFHLANYEPADPPHGWDSVHEQWNGGFMDGFVREHQMVHPESYTEVMGYHTRDDVPVLYALAESYTLCDHWFASVLGPTWPNRFFLHCASSAGQQSNLPEPGLPTIWAALTDAGLTGRNYYSDVAWVWGAFANPFPSYTDGIDEFFTAAQAGTLPSYVVIDPNFGLTGGGGNDDHPDHNIMLGQVFLASVYQALAESPQWDRCLLVITYDEHGGFFDHVQTLQTMDELPQFEQLGVRVPAVVIGPYVRRGCVNSTKLEHVAPIATLTRRHQLTPLNVRVEGANDLSSCIDPTTLREPKPPVRLPPIEASLDDLLTTDPQTSHPELRKMIEDGRIPLPPGRDYPGAGRDLALQLIAHAQRLGVLKLRT